MPLYVADYRADTAHLGALEHGIYLLLIMHYWLAGGLPDDDRQLARIASATDAEWRRAKPVIEKFFGPGWKHGRIDEELAKADEIIGKRRDAALQMHARRAASAHASAEQMQTHTQPLSPSHLQAKSSFKGIGSVKSGWTPPRHGATGKGRIYIEARNPDWQAYASDFEAAHGYPPKPNEHGGKWFKVLGEQSPDQQALRGVRAQIKAAS